MNKLSTLAAVAALFSLSIASQAASLNVGDKAPALKVAKWVKGKPITGYKEGRLTVVEFWATWCGPCKQSIPHLTEMAKKFKDKVDFVGVSVWEEQNAKDNSFFPKVEKFVTEMGDKMAYNVAIDGFEGVMAKTWLAAAGENGIPSAFIVDGTGTIQWIGHPMSGMDAVIESILHGEWDATAYAKMRKQEMAMQVDLMKIQELASQGKMDEALAMIDATLAKYPDQSTQLAGMKFFMLLDQDEDKAYDFAKAYEPKAKPVDAGLLNSMAWAIVDTAELKRPDFKLALKLAEKASKLTEDSDPMILDTLATAYFKNGNKAKAIEIEEKAISILKSMKESEDVVKEFEARLETFKKG